jgi:hypothetical protein
LVIPINDGVFDGIAWIFSDFIFGVKTQDPTFGGWIRQRRRLSVVPFLEVSLLENLFCCSCDVKRWLVRIVVVVVRRLMF